MVSVLLSEVTLRFVLVTGLGATILFDLWCLVARSVGVRIMDWSQMARYLMQRRTAPQGRRAAMRPHLVLSMDHSGTILPQHRVFGFLLTSYLGLGIMTPLLGGGFFAHDYKKPELVQSLTVAGHAIFAMGLYLFAKLASNLFF